MTARCPDSCIITDRKHTVTERLLSYRITAVITAARGKLISHIRLPVFIFILR